MAAPININANLNLNPSSINASAKQVQQALGRITGQASEFQKSLDASTARVFAFGATTSIINGINQSFKKLVSTTITVQAKLTEINSILGAGAAEFNKYRNSIFQVAKSTGQSFQTVADGAAELARQGLGATESAKRLEAALILTRISGLGAQQSVKALTAAMNGFTSAGLSAEQVINKIVAVDTAFAVSAQDLADGFSRAGSTAEDAGVSFDELLGLITAVEQRTARGGAVIGNAFKSIFTRLSRGGTIGQLQELGVAIDANQSGVQKLQALSRALEQVADPNVASQIKELAGGVFQINVVSAALKDIGSEASVFAQATKTGMTASNEATEKNAALNKTLLAQLNSLTASVTSFAEKLGSITFGPLLQNLVSLATKLSEGLDNALDPEKGSKFIQGLFKIIGTFISGPGLALFTVAFVKIFKTVIKFAREGFKTVMEIGSATERIKQLEGGLIGLLQKDSNLRNTLLSTTATQAQKEQAVIAAIQKENALLAQQQQLVTNISSIARSKGVNSFDSTSGSFKGKGGRRYASGGNGVMEPDLMTAMVNEAREAPAGASPYVTNFRGSPAVMNTSEAQVKIGGREEILTAEQIPRFNKGTKGGNKGERGNRFVFLTPKVGEKGQFGPMTVDKVKHNYVHPIRGIHPEKVKTISDPEESDIEKQVRDTLFQTASKWTKNISPLDKSASVSSVAKGFDKIKGAKGALNAAVGSAFEVGISKSLNFQSLGSDGGDFDVYGGKNINKIQELFGITQRIGDFKNKSDSRGNKESFVRKVRKEIKFNPTGEALSDKQVKKMATAQAIARDKRMNPDEYTSDGKSLKRRMGSETDQAKRIARAQNVYGTRMRRSGPYPTATPTPTLSKGTISNSRLASKTKIPRFAKGSKPKTKSSSNGLEGLFRTLVKVEAAALGAAKSKTAEYAATMRANNATINIAKAHGMSAESAKLGVQFIRQQVAAESALNEKRKNSLMGRAKSSVAQAGTRTKEFMTKERSIAGGFSLAKRATKGAGKKLAGGVKAAGGLGAGFGLSAVATGLGALSAAAKEAGNSTQAAAVDLASSATSFAATGAMIAGPWGAAAGVIIGLGKSIYDSIQKIDDAEKFEKEAAKPSAKFETLKITERNFGNQGLDKVKKRLKNLSDTTGVGGFDLGEKLEKARQRLDASTVGTKEFEKAADAYGRVAISAAKLLGEEDGIQSLVKEGKKLKSQLEAAKNENAGADLKSKLREGQSVVDVRSTLLSQINGPNADILQRQNQLGGQMLQTAGAKANELDLRNQVATTTDPAERKELIKQLSEAGKVFKNSVQQSAAILVSRQMQVQRMIDEATKKRNEMQATMLSTTLGEITNSLKQGPFDFNDIDDFKDDFKGAQTDEEKAEAIAGFETNVLSRFSGNEKMQNYLRRQAGLLANEDGSETNMITSQKELDRINAAVSVKNANKEEAAGFMRNQQSGQQNEQLGKVNERLLALQNELETVESATKKFAEDFNAQPVVNAVQNTARQLQAFANNTKAASGAAEKLVDVGNTAMTLAKKAEKQMEAQERKLDDIIKRLQNNEADIKKIAT